jgi:hypothetical protein
VTNSSGELCNRTLASTVTGEQANDSVAGQTIGVDPCVLSPISLRVLPFAEMAFQLPTVYIVEC